MAGNEVGNILGVKPVVGSKPDTMYNDTVISLLKRLQNQSGLGGFDFGFNNSFDVFNEKSAKSIYELERHVHGWERWFGDAALACGDDADSALADGNHTEFTIHTGGGTTFIGPVDIMMRRCTRGTKVWIRTWCQVTNTSKLDFFFGLHGYLY